MKITNLLLIVIIGISFTYCSKIKDSIEIKEEQKIDYHLNKYIVPENLKKCLYYGMFEFEFNSCLTKFNINRRGFIHFGSEVDTFFNKNKKNVVDCGVEIMGYNIDTVYTIVAIFKNYECKRQNVDSLQLRALYFIPGCKNGDNYYQKNDLKNELK